MSSRSRLQRAASALCLVLAALALAPVAAAGVIVVALDSSGDTTSLATAIWMAAPGDVILLREGNYAPFSYFDPEAFHEINKPLTIVGDGAGAFIGMIRVQSLPAGQEVVLRNLTMSGPLVGSFLLLEKIGVRDCNGAVIFEDCKAYGVTGASTTSPGLPAVDVRNSVAVTFTRCTLRGGAGLSPMTPPFIVDPSPGGPAVLVSDSKVALQHCTVIGGAGGTDTIGTIFSQTGGDGLRITDASSSTVFIGGGSITGGKGSDGGSPAAPESAAGGDGLVLDGAFSLVRLVGVTPAGGAGGTLSDGSSGPSGEGLVVEDGAVETYGEVARGTSMPAALNEGEAGTLAISGAPDEIGKIMVSIDLVHAQLGGKKGIFNLGGAWVGPIVLGTIPASGVLEFPVSFPPGTLHGLEGLRLDFQGFTFGAEGFMLGNPSSMVLLGPGL